MKKMMITAAAVATALTVMTGCQAKPAQNETQTTNQETTQADKVRLDDIYTAVKEAYGEKYIPGMQFDEQMMEDIFGLKNDLYDSYIGEGPMVSVQIDNFIAIEAKEGKGQEVQTIMEDYRESLLTDSMQYPMNLPKVQSSEVIRHGDYVFFVMLGTPSEESMEEGDEAALESSKETNQIAIDIINGFFK